MNENKTWLNCPFCGNDKKPEFEGKNNSIYAECGNCGARSEWAYSLGEALNNWNSRASIPESENYLKGYLDAKKQILELAERILPKYE